MFWWPVQGVSFATLPVVFACAMIKLLLNPQFNFTGGIPCKYSELASAQTDEKESETCREGRTGTCFLLAGLLMMVSGSRMMIPRLREVEEQFLLQQPTHLLSREGLTLRAEQRQQIRTVPIRWKRAHLIFVSLFLIFPLILLWEFTYCEFFGENALYFIIGFSFAMNFVDNALSKAVREELIQVPLSTACSVVLFIGTLGANDFVDFCEGFFLELLYGIAERLILGSLLEATEKGVAWGVHWAKTRSWFWRLTLLVTGGRSTKALLMNEGKDEDDVSPEEVGMEGTPIEEAMEEVIGCGTTCMSTIMTPFIISAIYFFASETEIPVQYDIRSTDLVCYLLFGVIIAPFQVMMDILMNHATELQNNVRIYDYMLYAKWRWRNRVTRWLFDDPRLDQSIAEPLQSVNHLAFSPQFYFIETYYTWGMLVSLLSITIFLRKNMNPLDDPALFILVGQMFLLNYLLDRLIRWLTSSVLWKPMDNSNFRIFSRSVALALQRKDAALGQEKYRQWFWQRHTGWLVNHLGDIFTPRSRERYKGKLSLLYQQALQLQKTHVYKTPGDAFPEPVGQQELPENLRLELEEDESDDEKSPLALKAGKGGGMLGLTLPGVKQKQESPGKLRASVALRRLDLPSMPQMPLAPLPPTEPEPIEDWPLQLMGEEKDKELQDAAGFGPLAALTGAAWLRVARRRLIMSRQSQEYTHEQPLNDVCGGCAVRANDPFVKERIGVWQHGPRFKVYFVGQLRALMTSFERHYNVPPMPFVPQQWQNWLDRHNAYQTLCVRCALERGLDPPPPQEAQTPSQPTTPKALPAPPTRDREESTDSEEEEALMLMEEQGTPQHDDASDIEFEPAETARFPNLVNVQVSQPAREMIVYWARQARRRLKRRRTIRYQPDTSSESEAVKQLYSFRADMPARKKNPGGRPGAAMGLPDAELADPTSISGSLRCSGLEMQPEQLMPSLIVQNLLDELMVRCKHLALGCIWQGCLQDRCEHERGCLVLANHAFLEENQQLRAENQRLKAENQKLREVNLENQQDLSKISTQLRQLQVPDNRVNIFCKNFSGRTYVFQVSLNEKVAELKQCISKKFDLEPELFKVMYRLRPLPENSVLKAQGLQSESEVSVCITSQMKTLAQLSPAKDKRP
ncbi:unnamed protein product [Effrenium voratum]|nr:unnamed protein product [Effrenium voratum]